MWSARFEDDGPGLLNAELADEYGVIMGMSHHEPCLRQGEEYKYLRGKDSIYGDAWNFKTNREGIIRFWEDGLKRSGKFENVITVGMRGEADTAIMGKGATLADNIELLRDVLRTHKNVGPWFPIIVRISAEERVPGGNTLEDTLEYLEYLDEFVDMYDVSCGLNPSLQYQIDSNFLPDGWRSYMARAVKDKFKKPVINAGNYRDPKVVEKVLESGDVDIVGMGRGLIAEPNWVKKVENGEEDILRKCISCNVGCAGNRIGVNRPILCTVNPAVPEGDVYKALKVNKNCNVVVVGAGTAGMEAACTAAEVGCNVFVLEKNDHIGGLSTFISDLPSKTRMKDFPKYL